MITQLIWDAGGTLFDTYPAVVAACHAALSATGADASPAWLLALFRRTTVDALRVVAATYGIAEPVLTARFEEAYEATEPELQPPFPFVREVCSLVVDLGGRNFVVTHRGRASLVRLLAAHRLSGYFTDCISEDDPYPRKPDPASILMLMARHALDPRTCLAVGDRELDIAAGAGAGIRTCFFGTDAHETPADLEITRFDQLLQWLGAQCPLEDAGV